MNDKEKANKRWNIRTVETRIKMKWRDGKGKQIKNEGRREKE